MTFEIDQGAYRLLLQLVLAQRLEINAIESALKNVGAVADSQIQEIRLQASKTAEVWSRDGSIDSLGLIRMHSHPNANMLVPFSPDARNDLRREINGQAPQG
jgi:hypothetical protein